MNSKRSLTFLLIALTLFSFPQESFAADDEDIPYAVRIPYRIVRGVSNVALGWTEILLRPIGERKTETFGEALGMGASNTFIRASAGITDIVTFWVPDIQMLEMYPDWQGWPYLFHWS